jgi:hypothetical protein
MMRRAVLCDGTCPWQAGTARICEAYLAPVEGGMKVYEFNCRLLIFKETDQGTRVRWDECWWQIQYSSESLRGPGWVENAETLRQLVDMATPDPRGSTWQLGKGAASFNHKWALPHACWTDQPSLKGQWKFGVYKMNGWICMVVITKMLVAAAATDNCVRACLFPVGRLGWVTDDWHTAKHKLPWSRVSEGVAEGHAV